MHDVPGPSQIVPQLWATAWPRVRFLASGGNSLNGSDDEYEARSFHFLLTAFLAWVVLMESVVVPIFIVRKSAVASILLVVGGAALAGLVLLRRGHKRAAAVLVLGVAWCAGAGVSLLSGGLNSWGISLPVAVVLGAALLLGRSAALGFAAASLVVSLIEAILQHTGHPPPRYFPGAPLALWATQVAVLVVVVGSSLAVLEVLRSRVAAQRESEERYKALFDRSLDCVFLVDLEGRFLDANQAALDLLGYRREDVTTVTFQSLLTEDQLALALRTAAEVSATGRQRNPNEYRLRRRDGDEVFVETKSSLIYRDGKPFAIQGIARDITGRKRVEEERAKLQEQLHQAQKMESIGRLAGGVAHDFNNLLTVINGYSQLLLARLGADDPLRTDISRIRDAGRHAAELTQQLLAFSRKQVLHPRILDLNSTVAEMQPMMARLVGEDVELRIGLHPETTAIRADLHQLKQVIMNLAVNSRDAMPHGGRLSIETTVVQLGESDVQLHAGASVGPYVLLTVSDTGLGMDDETRKRVFEPFFTTKEVGKGTGLGLSMIQGVVDQSGGFIEVLSEPGRGTTFRIYLPKVEDAPIESAQPESATATGGKETVLVVEDQADVRNYAAAALETYGYRVIQAENADEALMASEAKRNSVDLVLTDVVMPNVGGGGLADRLRKRWPRIKVLFMSGYADDAIVDRGLLKKDAEFIQKPFSPDQLAIKVREILAAPHRSTRILVADDAGSRGSVRRVLEHGGHEVIEAVDGRQALQEVRGGHVDLVITGLPVPKQKGVEIVRALRREAAGVGIIVISGAFGDQLLIEAQAVGADAVLNKPVSAELLLTTVEEVLKLRRLPS
jgi:hypothetical protein